jgi:tetratricopeptide (TPR) repeat protein
VVHYARATVRRRLAAQARGRPQALVYLKNALEDLTEVTRLAPDHWDSWRQAGAIRAALHESCAAALALGKAVQLLPQDALLQRQYALSLLRCGQEESFRKVCRDLLARFRDTTDAEVARDLAWLAALLPGTVDDPELVLALADTAVARNQRDPWSRHVHGAALFRAGRHAEAAAELAAAVQLDGKGGPIHTWFLLALALHQSGDAKQARAALERGVRAIEQGQGQGRTMRWEVEVELTHLRGEAEVVLGAGG